MEKSLCAGDKAENQYWFALVPQMALKETWLTNGNHSFYVCLTLRKLKYGIEINK